MPIGLAYLPEQLWLPQQLQHTARAASAHVRQAARGAGLTFAQVAVMATLWRQPDGIPVGAVCENLGLSSATVSPVLRRLHERGLVHREPSAFDARGLIVSPTDAAEPLREVVETALAATERADGLTADERDELLARLEQVCERLRSSILLEGWLPDPPRRRWPSAGFDVDVTSGGDAAAGS
ncbi:MarR family winged helix-turn-helix transcriptional regulator [Aquipuribacter sp. SD81]|uniref:MarR family winged helix-turn-helix transcriptional regulator n=1 Tax=Aquipuribacter sp. SD81 TaxID=3127703 RepID=UPI003017F58E